jgi:hypothetical protein
MQAATHNVTIGNEDENENGRTTTPVGNPITTTTPSNNFSPSTHSTQFTVINTNTFGNGKMACRPPHLALLLVRRLLSVASRLLSRSFLDLRVILGDLKHIASFTKQGERATQGDHEFESQALPLASLRRQARADAGNANNDVKHKSP